MGDTGNISEETNSKYHCPSASSDLLPDRLNNHLHPRYEDIDPCRLEINDLKRDCQRDRELPGRHDSRGILPRKEPLATRQRRIGGIRPSNETALGFRAIYKRVV